MMNIIYKMFCAYTLVLYIKVSILHYGKTTFTLVKYLGFSLVHWTLSFRG